MTDQLMCSYLSEQNLNRTPSGLILLRPDYGEPLQFAATASFLSKLYDDYLTLLHRSGWNCTNDGFSLEMLQSFSTSQASLFLSITSMQITIQHKVTTEVSQFLGMVNITLVMKVIDSYTQDRNPNILLGAMVAGPDQFDDLSEERGKPWFTEPSIASNTGSVAALIAHHGPPRFSSYSSGPNLGLDQMGIFEKIHFGFLNSLTTLYFH
ncbi:hypothetical protein CRYUN_Cryun27aG0033500 [Craigia yunnanensis]